jgi:hypothetical protein
MKRCLAIKISKGCSIMNTNNYKITIKTQAELVYYVSEYDIDKAIELAIDAPYREWEVSEFDMPQGKDVIAEEI